MRTDLSLKNSRRGFPVYDQNPSVSAVPLKEKERPMRIVRGNNMMLRDEATGEVVGEGVVAFLQRKVVDTGTFVKVFLSELSTLFDLSKTGQRVFMLLWHQVRANPNMDRVELTPLVAQKAGLDVSARVFQKGVRELLEKEFIFMSLVDGVYFINMSRIFNGDRVVTAREYVLKGSESAMRYEQPSLAFDEHQAQE